MLIIEKGTVKPHVSNPVSEDYRQRYLQAVSEFQQVRSTGYAFVQSLQLPAIDELTDVQKRLFCDGTVYNPEIMATVAIASKYVKDRNEFERMLGLHQNGYRSVFRANVMFRWKSTGVTLKELTKELRRMYHILKIMPVTGA